MLLDGNIFQAVCTEDDEGADATQFLSEESCGASCGHSQSPLLVTAHRVTIVNAGPLYAVRIRFQALRGAEFSAPISQNDRKYRIEFISCAQGFLQQFKHTPDSTGGAAVHEIGQK